MSQQAVSGLSCWALSEGHAGMENQCRGLAEAMGLTPLVKRVRPRAPWTWLPAAYWPFPFHALGKGSDTLAPPWPDILISCGRRSLPYALAIKQESGGKTFCVHIQSPGTARRRLDCFVVPRHDNLSGNDIVTSIGALHRVTRERLDQDARRFAPAFAGHPRPISAVLVGGPNRRYRLDLDEMEAFGRDLARYNKETGGTLAITPSRRTPEESMAALKKGLGGTRAVIWNGEGENPYFGYLGLADAVVATCDSVSMVSEACATGKPVYVAAFRGGNRRFAQFHREMQEAGYTRPFRGITENWTPPKLDETAAIAAKVLAVLQARAKAQA